MPSKETKELDDKRSATEYFIRASFNDLCKKHKIKKPCVLLATGDATRGHAADVVYDFQYDNFTVRFNNEIDWMGDIMECRRVIAHEFAHIMTKEIIAIEKLLSHKITISEKKILYQYAEDIASRLEGLFYDDAKEVIIKNMRQYNG